MRGEFLVIPRSNLELNFKKSDLTTETYDRKEQPLEESCDIRESIHIYRVAKGGEFH